jgi:acyl carrier protein
VKWRQVYGGSSAKFLDSIPKYPLKTSRYYVRFQDQPVKKTDSLDEPTKPLFEFLGPAVPINFGDLISFHTNLAPLVPYIKAHSVAGIPLCPASVLIEVALEAISTSQGVSNADWYLVENVVFEKPLVYTDQMAGEPSLQINLNNSDGKYSHFSLSSNDRLHCAGLISHMTPHDVVDTITRKSTFVSRQRRTVFSDLGGVFDSFSPRTIYQVIFPRVVAYDKPFLTLKQLSVGESRLEGCGTLQLDNSLLNNSFVCHPALLDTLLHTPGFIANVYVPPDVACICVSIERTFVPPTQHPKEGDLTIYCSLTDLGHSVIADAYIINSDEKIVAFIEGSCFKKIPLKSFNNHLSRSLRASAQKPPFHEPPQLKAPIPNRRTLHPSVSHIGETIQPIMHGSRPPQLDIDEASLESYSTLQELTSTVSKASGLKSLSKVPTPDLTREDTPKTQEVTLPSTPTPNDEERLSHVKRLLVETCGIQIEADMMDLPLATLGVDSLLSIELSDELRETFGVIIDESQQSISELTINRLGDLFTVNMGPPNNMPKWADSQISAGASPLATIPTADTAITFSGGDHNIQRTIQQQTHGRQKCNVYLFHDGSGYCSMYSRMSAVNRNITGISSPDLSSGIKRIEDLASFYIKRTNLENEQEVVLGGKQTEVSPI